MKNLQKLQLIGALCMAGVLISCSNSTSISDEGRNPLAASVKGLWWTMVDTTGSYSFEKDDTVKYTRVGHALELGEDGSGYVATYFFNDEESDPIAMIGGNVMGGLTYSSTEDGQIELDFDKSFAAYADYYKSWQFAYSGGSINVTAGNAHYDLERPTDALAAVIKDWDSSTNGGASADNYNINDADINYKNWRKAEAIYVYDGVGKDVKDAKGRTGYTLVNLPWYKGDVLTNLPEGFTDDITPENGWEWVLNRCGSRAIKNNNFFAVYNKYLGILRFFYYLPYEFSSGNDHVWQVSMYDNLAQFSIWNSYGVPMDLTIKDKSLLGQTGKSYMQYVTPWVDFTSEDGLIVPNAGWWAFDVDLSLYRPSGKIAADDNIKLQMRSWHTDHTSLYSTMNADIKGTIDQKLQKVKQKSSSSAKGVLMGLQAAAQASASIYNFMTGGIAQGFSSFAQVLGTGASISGLGSSGGGSEPFHGTVTLGLRGEINTEGFIKGSVPTTGVASPTFQMSAFDTRHSLIGQGTWNLKTSPVVYKLSANVEIEAHDALLYFFDPSSIQVELNPKVFPQKEIEWMQVDAVCISRRATLDGANQSKAYANAVKSLGLTDSYENIVNVVFDNRENIFDVKFDYRPELLDFFNWQEDKAGLEFPKELYQASQSTDWRYQSTDPRVFGRGISENYLVEPGYLTFFSELELVIELEDGSTDLMDGGRIPPNLEINVFVTVKMKNRDAPIVMNRFYLPKIKKFESTDKYREYLTALNNHKLDSKQKGHRKTYDYQVKRINELSNQLGMHAITSKDYTGKLVSTDGSDQTVKYLFDGEPVTAWDMYRHDKGFVEFHSEKPITPTGYYLMTTNWTGFDRNPDKWKLYGKKNQGDEWTLVDEHNNGGLSEDDYIRSYFPMTGTKGEYQYFRFEIENSKWEYARLAEFSFTI